MTNHPWVDDAEQEMEEIAAEEEKTTGKMNPYGQEFGQTQPSVGSKAGDDSKGGRSSVGGITDDEKQ